MDFPAALLYAGQGTEDAPLVVLPGDAAADEERTGSPGEAQAALERVHHHLARQVLGGDGELAKCPPVADSLGQRERHFLREPMEPTQSQLLRHQRLQPIAIELANRLQ